MSVCNMFLNCQFSQLLYSNVLTCNVVCNISNFQSWAHRSYKLSERSKAVSDLWFSERKKMGVERWANWQKKEFAHRSERSLNLKERALWSVRSLSDVSMLIFWGAVWSKKIYQGMNERTFHWVFYHWVRLCYYNSRYLHDWTLIGIFYYWISFYRSIPLPSPIPTHPHPPPLQFLVHVHLSHIHF